MVAEPEQGRADSGVVNDHAEISLWAYVDTLRNYRRIIVGALVAVSVVFVIGVLAMFLTYPTERVGSIEFRLLFDGAELGQYPNKTPFSAAEIVGAPVVTDVFNTNDLQSYGTYESFKNALFVQQSNAKLDQLAAEYQAKLADSKLTSVDRARLEAEFSQKREALTDPVFSLSLRRSERFKTLPSDLAQKVLTDTLATWAVQAERMGAMKYQLPILSSAVLSKQSFDDEDYLVAADLLRAKAVRIIETLGELEKVPGALTIRTTKDKVSLPEIRANIEDALRFELEPLLGIIRSEGITKNARLLTLYASTQVFQLKLERQATEGRARAVQSALADYISPRGSRASVDAKSGAAGAARQPGFDTPALIPQFSESFLDRLVQISSATQKSEMEYRQGLTNEVIKEESQIAALDKELAYYEDLVRSVQGIGSRPAGSPELVTLIKSRSLTAFGIIAKATDQLADLYKELSAQNLSPVARLFAVTGPFVQHTTPSVSLRSVGISFALVLMLTLVGMLAGCLIHDAIRRRPQP